MDAAKLGKIKDALAGFEELVTGVQEMIEELEDNVDQDVLTETLDTLEGLETSMSEAESMLDDINGTISSAAENVTDCVKEIRALVRFLEDKKKD